MFISTAWAQAGGAGGGGDIFTAMLPLVLIFAVFYFLLIRPQQKKMKTHQAMIGSLKRGDKIITGGGVHGTVTKLAIGQPCAHGAHGAHGVCAWCSCVCVRGMKGAGAPSLRLDVVGLGEVLASLVDQATPDAVRRVN